MLFIVHGYNPVFKKIQLRIDAVLKELKLKNIGLNAEDEKKTKADEYIGCNNEYKYMIIFELISWS